MNITIISDNIYTQKGSSAITMAKALNVHRNNVSVILPYYEKIYSNFSFKFGRLESYVIKLPLGNFNIDLYSIKEDDINYYFIANSRLFAREKTWGYNDDAIRTSVFCNAAIETIIRLNIPVEYLISDSPNTALIPVLIKFKHQIKSKLRNTKCYHYINSQDYGRFDKSFATSVFGLSPEEKHFLMCKNEVNLTKAAIITASRVFVGENAVSLLYDRNSYLHHTVIQFGFKIRKLRLGIDYNIFSPDNDTDIHKCYSADNPQAKIKNKIFVQKNLYLTENEEIPLVALYPDTHINLFNKYVQELIRCDIQLIIIANKSHQTALQSTPDKCICISDRSAETLKNIFSAADFCIFGGLSSACGNPAFISAAYGCVPIIPSHRFFDFGFNYFNKLTLDGNGYTYDQNISKDMVYTLWDALGTYKHDKNTYNKLLQNTMKKVFSANDSIDAVIRETETANCSFI